MNPQRTVIICINGIRTKPDDFHGWTDEFVTDLNIRTPDWIQVEKFEYYVNWWNRWYKQSGLAKELIAKIKVYIEANYRIVLIGHSNGCDLIARALAKERADSIHLFAAAAWEKDFESIIEAKQVKRVHLYGSPDDSALKTAGFTSKFLKVISLGKLGYGSMGLRNTLAEKYPDIVKDHSIKGYGHSTWFIKGERYNYTITLLMKNEKDDRLLAETVNILSKVEEKV